MARFTRPCIAVVVSAVTEQSSARPELRHSASLVHTTMTSRFPPLSSYSDLEPRFLLLRDASSDFLLSSLNAVDVVLKRCLVSSISSAPSGSISGGKVDESVMVTVDTPSST